MVYCLFRIFLWDIPSGRMKVKIICLRTYPTGNWKLQDLFSFSGLPRYVLIDRDGKVLNDDLDFAYRHVYLYDLGITLN